MFAKWCKQCGAPLPDNRPPKQLYCSPLCRKKAFDEREGKTAPGQSKKGIDAAPGCGCGKCAECRLYGTMKADSKIWHEAQAKANRAS